MTKQSFLCELGTEELPPKALQSLSEAFTRLVCKGLKEAGLKYENAESFATPRRLAILIEKLDANQPNSRIERYGPAVKAAFDQDGNATKAAEGFAKSCGVSLEDLEQKNDGKVDKLYFQSTNPGKDTPGLLPDIINQALTDLPIPKRMRWGSKRDEFVRPVHWVLMMFGEAIIPCEILGLQASNTTFGHRFLSPASITITQPEEYSAKLLEAQVIASFKTRRSNIQAQIEEKAAALKASAQIDPSLLDEVTSLVEWPVALAGSFSEEYLAVPKEALISSLKEHQKCFTLLDDNNDILPNFITISNIISENPDTVISGNERVIGPRLADASFFYEQDKKHTLASRQSQLESVIFQKQLGTLADKSHRVSQIAVYLADNFSFNASQCERAAKLGKCDLLTSMVGEFADLQGIMGYYYALNDNEDTEVAQAIKEQYLPRFSGDALPLTQTGMVLAVAERLDTISGLFAINQPPSGSKDPFALRRSTIGLLRILIENGLDLDLNAALTFALSLYPDLSIPADIKPQILDFIFERFRSWYTDQGINVNIFQAVDAVRPSSPIDFNLRIDAVHNFTKLKESSALAAANKRVANIISKLEELPGEAINTELLEAPEEKQLYKKLSELEETLTPLFVSRNYKAALEQMASLQAPIDNFFDNVMVNTENQNIRSNRITLVQKLRLMFLKVADISFLQNN